MEPVDISVLLSRDEGQYHERKSAYHGPDGDKRPRNNREIGDDIVEAVAAFANADGGILVVGAEDNGDVTGHKIRPSNLRNLLDAPVVRLRPPQSAGTTRQINGEEVLVFNVPPSPEPIMVDGDGFPYRSGEHTVKLFESEIAALKRKNFAESWESHWADADADDLDPELLALARASSGLEHIANEEYLIDRQLAARRGGQLRLRNAALLAFGKTGPDHPNAGVRIMRVIGSQREYGPAGNVEHNPRYTGNLYQVLSGVRAAMRNIIRKPARMRSGFRFQETPEYPQYAWQEAISNALAHRDYAVTGVGTEVWLYEDRMTVINPGELTGGLSLQELSQANGVHYSRNPRLMRALADLGVVQDIGEGIPRIFDEMDNHFLEKPRLSDRNSRFSVTLYNRINLKDSDREFIAGLPDDLTPHEQRTLVFAYRKRQVDNRSARRITGLDTFAVSKLLTRLRDRQLLNMHGASINTYYTIRGRNREPAHEQLVMPGLEP